MRKYIAFIVCFVFLGICILSVSSMIGTMKDDLKTQRTKITSLKNQIAVKTAENQSSQDEVVQTSTGYDAMRRMEDDTVAVKFLDKCLTWSNYKEYMAVREEVMKEYGLKKDSKFMKVFFPEVKSVKADETYDYNYIDANGLNMSYSDMDSYVVDIDDDGTYSYFTFVTVVSQNKTGVEGETQASFSYKVTKDGKIYDIDANQLSS